MAYWNVQYLLAELLTDLVKIDSCEVDLQLLEEAFHLPKHRSRIETEACSEASANMVKGRNAAHGLLHAGLGQRFASS